MKPALSRSTLPLCAFLLLSAAPNTGAQMPAPATATADAQFRAIYTADEAWRRAQRGESGDDRRRHIEPHLPSVDAATEERRLQHAVELLQVLDTVDPKALSAPEALNYDVLREQVIVERNALRFREYERPVDSDSAFWSGVAGPEHEPLRSEEEYTALLERMRDTPRFFQEEIANMRAGLKRGFTAPQVTLQGRDVSLRAVSEAKSPQDTEYYKAFEAMPASIAPERQAALRAQAAEVIAKQVQPAYRDLLRFWMEEYLPHAQTSLAAESLPDGKAYYQSKILEYTTTELTPAEIHTIGLSEMAKIHAEMLQIMKETGFSGDLQQYLQALRTDPQSYARTPEELLMRAAYIAKEFDGVAPRFFGMMPRGRFAIRPVPAAIAPFYTSARGGADVYLVNTYDLGSRALYSLPALTLHESAPGHSWQLALANEHKDLPRFRNAYISAYGEGWALYCERLGVEMGMYHTPRERFGMLSYQAWRAARLVVDTGLHAQGWTRTQAQQYLLDNTALSQHEVETEVDRYISWPGQALSYYLGELAIQRSRHKAEAALGPRFNLRAFHDAVLETGSVPLPVLERHIDAWVAGGGIGPYADMER